MAVRSFDVKVQNLSGEVLQRKDLNLAHGIWANANNEVPPEQIRAGKTAIFGAESDGAATGCEGATTYVSDSGEWHIYFDNPYFGSNQFSVTTPSGFAASFGDITGNNAAVKVVLTPPEN